VALLPAKNKERRYGKECSQDGGQDPDRQADRFADPPTQRATLVGLGLNKMHRTRTLEDTPSVRGMIASIPHLVAIVDEK